jgi:3-deoxy-D-manno-octulosonic-acid transferase
MNWVRWFYTLLLFLLIPFVLLRLIWRGRRQPGYLHHVAERFGHYREAPPPGALIWLHAVSVGETRAAEPLIKALQAAYPSHRILLTHMTPTGRETSEQLFGDRILRCYLPYDLPFAVAAFLRHFRPTLGALLETELWPNLIRGCHTRDVPMYLVNARLSEHSARGYARIGSLARDALGALAGIGAQTDADAARLRTLGAQVITVTGNLKFDRGPSSKDLELGARFRTWIGGQRTVFVAASTREGEEALILDAIESAPMDLLAIIVPRHPQRFDEVAKQLERRGITYQRRSATAAIAPATRVWLGDSMGELFAYYAASDIAFIGGSLLPLGGQNLLEACAVGRPVLIGPHSFNFAEATRLAVTAGAAIEVADSSELGSTIAELLSDPERRLRMGEAGIALMREHQGATQRTLALLHIDES